MNNSEFKVPSSPLALYVKLYCKKRKENKFQSDNVLIEATKSWLTLSEFEKQQFTSKYHQLKKDIKRQFGHQLKNAVPYLKKKEVPVTREVAGPGSHSEEHEGEKEYETEIEENNTLNVTNQSAIQNSEIPNVEGNTSQATSHGETNSNNENAFGTPIQDQTNKDTNENCEIVLSEPTPPTLLTGRQLFELVNEKINIESWTTLSKTEKGKYQNAVLSIKRNYLKDYKKYLEQLPSRTLYELYRNSVSPL